MKRFTQVLTTLLIVAIASLGFAQTTPKLFLTECTRVGGDHLSATDVTTAANFDLISIERFDYTDFGGAGYPNVRTLNPNLLIYTYQMGSEDSNQDANQPADRNAIDRWSTPAPGLSTLVLLDSSGNPEANTGYPGFYLMDFGSTAWQTAWVSASQADIATQAWVADGFFVDGCSATQSASIYTPAKYPNDTTWMPAMSSFINAITSGAAAYGQKIYCNRGGTSTGNTTNGIAAWLALDASAYPPDALMEEGAFVVAWGGGTQFWPESNWKGEIDLMGQIHHSKTVWNTHTSIATGGTGTDNYGQSVGYYDVLWYAMGSYLLGKNVVDNNSYLAFPPQNNSNLVTWFPEWTPGAIPLGTPVSTYTMQTISGTDVYSRRFTGGYVYVNPTTTAASVTFPAAGSVINHANFTSPPAPSTSYVLPGHRAIILLTSSAPAPAPPTNLRILP